MISETGEAVLQVDVTDRVKGKEIYIPLNNDAMENGDLGAINLLTNTMMLINTRIHQMINVQAVVWR